MGLFILVPRSLVDEAEGEIWQSKKDYFAWLAAPFDSCPIPSLKIYAVFRAKLECVKCYKIWRSRRKLQHLINLCRLRGKTTNTNQWVAIFSDYETTAKLQRLISDFAKVRVQEGDFFPKQLCRYCYRTLLSLRDKLLAFQTKCATAQINLGRGGGKVKRTQSSPKSSPFTSPCGVQIKAKKESHGIQTQNSRKASFHNERERSSSSSSASDKVGPVNKEANCTFPIDQSYLSFQVAEISAQRSMVETTPQLSSNSSSTLETSAIGEKEKQIRKDERRKCFEVIYNSVLNNPEVGFADFLSFARSMRLFEGMQILGISGICNVHFT